MKQQVADLIVAIARSHKSQLSTKPMFLGGRCKGWVAFHIKTLFGNWDPVLDWNKLPIFDEEPAIDETTKKDCQEKYKTRRKC